MKSFKKNIYRTASEDSCPDCITHDVIIDTQTWTGCNANIAFYNNGDPIPYVDDPAVWITLTTGAWCYYDNDLANEATYGKLYNWYAITDLRGIAPTGYHVPTDTEWNTLTTNLGGSTIAGGKLKEDGLCHWLSPNNFATNISGFTGLPGGVRSGATGLFSFLGSQGLFTGSSLDISNDSCFIRLQNINQTANTSYGLKKSGLSLRFIKDVVVPCPDVTIGTQIWTSCNTSVSKYSDSTDIPEVTDPTAWAALTTGAWCYYSNNSSNGTVYGKLYNWYAVAGIFDAASLANPALRKQFAPTGYHVPTDAEYSTLFTFLGGTSIAGGKMKEVGTTHWSSPNTGATNTSGFTALGSGIRNSDGTFSGLLGSAAFKCFNDYDINQSWYTGLSAYNASTFILAGDKKTGFSIRFVKD
jgi:uncharacterized protein (TIGR02145 family)